MENPKTQESTVIVDYTEKKNGHNSTSEKPVSIENVEIQKTDETSVVTVDSIDQNVKQEKETKRERFKDILLGLGLLTIMTFFYHLIGSFINLGTLFSDISSLWNSNPDEFIENTQLGVNIANIFFSFIAMVFFLRLFKSSNSFFSIGNMEKYKEISDLNCPEELQKSVEGNPVRVKNLASQFVLFISLFAFSLVSVYASIIIHTLFKSNNNIELKKVLDETESNYNSNFKNLSFAENPNLSEQDKTTLKKRDLKIKEFRSVSMFDLLTNIINYLGALFIFLAFKVLHDETLQDDNTKSTFFWVYPVCFSIIYVLVLRLLYLVYETNGQNATYFLNITDLFAGLANGLAMALLFGRYVSIEQSVKETNLSDLKHTNFIFTFPYKKLVSQVIIIILPIYALAQPLFGSLTIDSFGDPNIFQTIVYLICLVGKIFFFVITYLLIRKKLLHLYLHGVVANIGNFKELEKCLDFDKTNDKS
jgi:hypothetical protein